jgi:two-component system, NtrC family, sensor kinase
MEAGLMYRHVRWWHRLSVKLAAVLTLVSVATMAGFLALMLASQRRHLMAEALGSAAFVSDTITRSIQHDMLRDQREDAYQILGEIARNQHIERLRIFDAAGRIRYSTDPAEINRVESVQSDTCNPCHVPGRSPAPVDAAARTRILDVNGRRILGAVTPIYNQSSCSSAACHVHPPSQRVVGAIELGLALEAVDRESGVLERSTIALSLFAALTLGSLTFVFARRLVVEPVSRLLQTITRVSEGDLNHQLTGGTNDEFGALESSFNQMTRALAQTQAEHQALLASLEQQVTERTAALEKVRSRLVQADRLSALGQLSASIAHEINNPLAGILTSSKLLIRTIEGDKDGTSRNSTLRLLALVQREAERCSAIVRNLLGFARERELKVSDTDVNAALDEALSLTAHQFTLQNVEIERQFGAIPLIQGDFGQLRQAFVNIVINAADAMPAGGRLRVRTEHSAKGDEVVIEFADTGIGIQRERLSKVFDPFVTSKEKGTGLGLSVVYGIVQRHGGRIAIQSEVGVGTTVTLWLPRKGGQSQGVERAPADTAA